MYTSTTSAAQPLRPCWLLAGIRFRDKEPTPKEPSFCDMGEVSTVVIKLVSSKNGDPHCGDNRDPGPYFTNIEAMLIIMVIMGTP